MTPEEIQELLEEQQNSILEVLAEYIAEAKTEIYSTVDQKNGGLMASIKRKVGKVVEVEEEEAEEEEVNEEVKKTSKKSVKETLAVKQLKQELDTLTAKLAEKERKMREKDLDATVTQNLSKTINPALAKKAFMLEYQEQIKTDEEGTYYLGDGEDVITLDEAVNKFLETDFGKTFLPPTKNKPRGLNLPEESKPAAGQPVAKDIDSLLDVLFIDD